MWIRNSVLLLSTSDKYADMCKYITFGSNMPAKYSEMDVVV